MPEIALAKVPKEAPLDVLCTLACGATTGIGAALYIAKVEQGSTVAVFGAGLVGPRRGRGRKARRRRADPHRRPERRRAARKARRARRHRRARGRRRRRRADPRADGRLRHRLHVRGDRPGRRHAPGRRGGAHGLGPVRHRRRRRQGRDAERHPALPDHRPARSRARRSAARAAATTCPALAQLYLDGKLPLDAFISHHLPLDRVNDAFDLMHDQDGIRTVLTFD